jgi:hypothetical protein
MVSRKRPNECMLSDTSLLYIQTEVVNSEWHAPMAIMWDYTLVKAVDQKFTHKFPVVLVGCIFKSLKSRYMEREHVHIIKKEESHSFTMDGLSSSCATKWGVAFPPNNARPSDVYRECLEEEGAWIDTESHILYYGKKSNEYIYEGIWSMFGGSNPIPRKVRCSEEIFSRFLRGIRENYIRIACSSALVCVVEVSTL